MARKLSQGAFRTGSWVVYPSHGPGKVSGREKLEFAGRKVDLLTVQFPREKMTLKIPRDKFEELGLRPVSPPKSIREAMKVLRGKPVTKRTMWSRRAQEYTTKLHSGDLAQIAEVLRDLYKTPDDTEQSFSERELYKDALDRFSRELSAAQETTQDEAIGQLEQILRRGAASRSTENSKGATSRRASRKKKDDDSPQDDEAFDGADVEDPGASEDDEAA